MIKKLGFGCMRLPLLDSNDQTSVDLEQMNQMVDTFLASGFSYFDTALPYHAYHSEQFVRESLVKRHPRETFKLATKLPPRMLKTEQDQQSIFDEQLEKCGVDFFDYYLLHNIGVSSYAQAKKFNSFDFVLRKKHDGLIRQLGMSFHDTPELLEEILALHHQDLDFVQLQINYIDWENPGIQSRRCYEVARKYNLPIIVMEPCKGGSLAVLPEKAAALMRAYNPTASIPSWAIRYAAGLEGVMLVLSGMSTMEQVLDNTSYMADFTPLNADEHEIIRQAVDIINTDTAVACTNCRYCVEHCPSNIPIPDYFALYNSAKRATSSNFSSQYVYYLNMSAQYGKAQDCIGCRACEEVCPQHLEVSAFMQDVSKAFDNGPGLASERPTRA